MQGAVHFGRSETRLGIAGVAAPAPPNPVTHLGMQR
jgi:hypothetical protein